MYWHKQRKKEQMAIMDLTYSFLISMLLYKRCY